MLIGTLQSAAFGFPQTENGADAAVADVNASGGIDGRKIEILTCNDNFDPNAAAACAQKAVTEKVAAVVTGYTSYGANIVPILEAAKIAWVGSQPLTSQEWNSPVTFPLDPGPPGIVAEVADRMYQKGCTKLAVLGSASGPGATAVGAAKTSFTHAGGDVVYNGDVSPTTADITPFVTAALKSSAECIIPIMVPASYIKFLTAIRQSSNPEVMISNVGLQEAQLKQLGPMTDGLLWAGATYPIPASPQAAAFVAAMKADGGPADDYSARAYSAVQAVLQAAHGLSAINNESILDALGKLTFKSELYPAPIDFAKPGQVEGASRLFNATFVGTVAKGGKFVPDGQPFDTIPVLAQVLKQ